MAAFVALILAIVYFIKVLSEEDVEVIDASAIVIKTVADLGPPPSIVKKPPQVKIKQPNIMAPKVGIPKPVADDEVLDEDIVLATREELAEIVAPNISSMNGSGDINVDIDYDYIPNPDEFIPVEIMPEIIHQTEPEYPPRAKQAGISGIVWLKALIDKTGSVRSVMVVKTSGTSSLDDAAVKAAYNNKFKPGIQNGQPIYVWVTYKVNFNIEN